MNQRCLYCMEEYDDKIYTCPFCGHSRDEQSSDDDFLKPNTIINLRYSAGAVLCRNENIITYACYDNNLNKKVILNEFYPTKLISRKPNKETVEVKNKTDSKQFEKKMSVFLSNANWYMNDFDSDSMGKIYDCFTYNATAYAVSEYLEGTSLKDMIESEGEMDFSSVMYVLIPFIGSIAQMHDAGIIYGGLSPERIIFQEDGNIKLTDIYTQQANACSAFSGNEFLAPEHSSNEIDTSGDIYSLGALIYYMLTAQMPESANSRKQKDTLKLPQEVLAELPKNADKLIMKSLALEKKRRIKDAAAFHDYLKSKTPGNQLREREPISPLLLSSAAVMLILVVLASVLYITGTVDVFSFLRRHSSAEERVPNTIGMELEAAYNVCSKEKIALYVDNVSYSETIPENCVVSQRIVTLSEESGFYTVAVDVSAGKEDLTVLPESNETVVPILLAENLVEAKKILSDIGLKPVVLYGSNDYYPKGVVFKQETDPGAVVEKGTEYIIYVNLSGLVEVELPTENYIDMTVQSGTSATVTEGTTEAKTEEESSKKETTKTATTERTSTKPAVTKKPEETKPPATEKPTQKPTQKPTPTYPDASTKPVSTAPKIPTSE